MRWWLRAVGALALVAASGVAAHAQMGIARGKVVDQDGAPVAGATVRFDFLGGVERRFTTDTDDNGAFTQMVASGRYRVTVSKDGYQGGRVDQAIPSGTPTVLPTFEIVNREAAAQAALAPVLEQFGKARELSEAGRLDEAVDVYLQLAAERQDIPELYVNLGSLYRRQEKWPEAEAAYQKALELRPDDSQVRVLLAEVHKNMGRSDEALAEMERLIQESPEDPQVHYNLGIFYLNAQRHEEAYAAFDEARSRAPGNVDVLYLLGTLSLNLGRLEQAVDHLQSYLDRAPADGQYRATASELLSKIQPAEPGPQ